MHVAREANALEAVARDQPALTVMLFPCLARILVPSSISQTAVAVVLIPKTKMAAGSPPEIHTR